MAPRAGRTGPGPHESSRPSRQGNTVSLWTKIQNREKSLSPPGRRLRGCYLGRTGSATSSRSWPRSTPSPSSPPWACARKKSMSRGKTCCGKRSERADLIVRNDSGTPIALLEIKASAAQHGDQFGRYDRWAKAQPQPPACYLIALDTEALNLPKTGSPRPPCPSCSDAGRTAATRTRHGSPLPPLPCSNAG